MVGAVLSILTDTWLEGSLALPSESCTIHAGDWTLAPSVDSVVGAGQSTT